MSIKTTLFRVAAGTALSAALITGGGSIASATTTPTGNPLATCYVSIDGAAPMQILVSHADCVTLQNAHTTAAAAAQAAEHRAVIRGRHQEDRRDARHAAAAAANVATS